MHGRGRAEVYSTRGCRYGGDCGFRVGRQSLPPFRARPRSTPGISSAGFPVTFLSLADRDGPGKVIGHDKTALVFSGSGAVPARGIGFIRSSAGGRTP
jgi:hypothetical protein